VRIVRRLLIAEGLALSLVGGLVGLLAAVGYGWGLIAFLAAFWPGQLDRSLLRLHVSPASLAIGYAASVVVGLLTIAWAVRVLGRVPPTALLGGRAAGEQSSLGAVRTNRSRWLAGVSAMLGIGLIGAGMFVKQHEAQAGSFFGGGALLLTAGLACVWSYLRREEPARQAADLHVSNLGMRNAARHPTRSLLTAGLLAASAFLIVAVESFRREPARDFLKPDGGSGGFALLAESDVPIYRDLNQGDGRQEILNALQIRFQEQPGTSAKDVAKRLREVEQEVLEKTRIVSLRLRAGDDTSCLNLYQPGRPRLLGAPAELIARGGFAFAGILDDATQQERENPWLLLQRDTRQGIPVFGEQNSVTWMLGKKLGDVYEMSGEHDEHGQPLRLRIVGLLKDSVFQSELVLAEASFLRLYPAQQGYNFFLIETPPALQEQTAGVLETALASRGFDVTGSADRLAGYLAVENTYLSTFQLLGGLGLVLGSLGLAVVLLRSVWERRGELALLQALGFRRKVLGWLVLAENLFLLGLGLLAGTLTALLSVAPHVLSGNGQVPWLRLGLLLGLVVVVGLAAGSLALRATLRAPLLPALRRE
jgi:hypothetical protein